MDLVADIGGTNTRLAFAEAGCPLSDSICSYRNDEFDTFDGPLDKFLSAAGRPKLASVCVAIAGPVRGSHGQLTNRDWQFDTDRIARTAGASRAVLMNDLAALGHALPHLSPDQCETIRSAGKRTRRNGQSFVLGLGTGVNVSVSAACASGEHRVLEAEAGHIDLPTNIRQQLEQAIGSAAVQNFPTLEELFAGRGLAALHACLSDQPEIPAHDVITQCNETARDCVELYARLLGFALRELILLYLPLEGVYLAGGVSRGVMSTARSPFLDALASPHMMGGLISAPKISLILDDAAALTGCAARLQQDRT